MKEKWIPTDDTVVTVWSLANRYGQVHKQLAKMTGLTPSRVKYVLENYRDPTVKKAGVAQLVERQGQPDRLRPNEQVVGSSPIPGAILLSDGVFE